ncbi:hypothetical protein FN846DRAFT_1026022 [Sphaerosporella brunnea]|uniref:Uncharacterized protein n=1 Tax=Sphaerosporella brunnea TaxID=1250544 RepID=A0A5J5EC79_9PEZI|nr:hypothetical protein FN846DRAFT_1026022 [Sphaerosporella brunnea]
MHPGVAQAAQAHRRPSEGYGGSDFTAPAAGFRAPVGSRPTVGSSSTGKFGPSVAPSLALQTTADVPSLALRKPAAEPSLARRKPADEPSLARQKPGDVPSLARRKPADEPSLAHQKPADTF